jgi:dynein heavy chain, axonemal
MDETLINKLQSSKKFAAEINQRVKDSKVTEAEIDRARESYRPVAFRASLLYFCILDLSSIDPMYQYSLQWFSNLFLMGLENSPPSNVLEERLASMNDYFTYSLYENVCRSLFEKHKLIFSFMLTTKILFGNKALREDEFRYFLAGPSGEIKVPTNPTTWINENAWPDVYKQIYGMSTTLSAYKGLDEYFMKKPDEFKNIFDSSNAHEEPMPEYWNNKLNYFQKILFLKALRSDKVIPAIQNWITEQMGERFIISPTFDLAKCYKDSSIQTPLIFVLSAGSDPVADFLRFA